MPSTEKSNVNQPGGPPPEAEEGNSEAPDTFTGPFAQMAQNGMQVLIEAQKRTLEIAAQQSTAAMDAVKAGVRATTSAPPTGLLDVAAKAVETAAGVQKDLVDVAVRQSALLAGAIQERSANSPGQFLASVVEAVQNGVEQAAAAQAILLDHAAKQQKLAIQGLKLQAGMGANEMAPVSMVVEAMQKTVEAVIDTEKQFLDLIGRQASSLLTAARGEGGAAGPAKNLTDIARQGIGTFVEAQKQLFDLLSQKGPKARAAAK